MKSKTEGGVFNWPYSNQGGRLYPPHYYSPPPSSSSGFKYRITALDWAPWYIITVVIYSYQFNILFTKLSLVLFEKLQGLDIKNSMLREYHSINLVIQNKYIVSLWLPKDGLEYCTDLMSFNLNWHRRLNLSPNLLQYRLCFWTSPWVLEVIIYLIFSGIRNMYMHI